MNPLLDYAGLSRFDEFKPALVASVIDVLLAECCAIVSHLTQAQTPVTWEQFVQPLIDANERLGRTWGQIAHLNAVVNKPELREAYNAALPKVTQYWTELGQNETLFERYRALSQAPEFSTLSPGRRRIIENELRDFRLGGAELPPERKQRFKAVREQLAELTSRFSDNILDATDAFSHIETDPARV